MTIEELTSELTDEGGSFDEAKAVRIHTAVVAAAAASAESVIRDLDLLNRAPEAIDPAEILRALAQYAESESQRRLLEVLAGASAQLREVAANLPSEQAAAVGELVGRLQGAGSIDALRRILLSYGDNSIDAVREGGSYARDILDDGEQTIYDSASSPIAEVASDPNDPPQEQRSRAVLEVAKQDVSGALSGAAAGATIHLMAVLPSAVTGAVSGSVGSIFTRVMNRRRGRR